ncbi:ribonuclease H2 subunit A isoform X2 [Lepeophtheirus salmonis]|nr:ribonuclease H2 subunit A-like isoform X2 [Lepeophtheirus salmonis]XP_040567475.1 ribonuclease H2 subunit A-like isoform X2 [Lepeophtheirus salmonis]
MVYGTVFCPIEKSQDLKDLGVDDSKVLKEEAREELWSKLLENQEKLGIAWILHVLSPLEISKGMLKRSKYNLNTLSHDTAIALIQRALTGGARISQVYVDTVGPPEKYQAKLQEIFPGIQITVAKKADSLYPCVSAASIGAKIARDKCLNNWDHGDYPLANPGPWGSGYPGDPVTKKFLADNIHPVFGFPSIVRSSWKTADNLCQTKAIQMKFEEIDPEEDVILKNNPSVKNYFVSIPDTKRKNDAFQSHQFFKNRNLIIPTEF